jgi:hypothetical protein
VFICAHDGSTCKGAKTAETADTRLWGMLGILVIVGGLCGLLAMWCRLLDMRHMRSA